MAVSVSLVLAGCGNIATIRSFSTPYAEPVGGAVAQLRVVSNGMVRAVPGKTCIDWRSPGAGVMVSAQRGFANMNHRDLHMPRLEYETTVMVSRYSNIVHSELRVAAGQPITFNFISQGYLSAGTHYACHASLSFIPQAGQNYEAFFLELGSECISKIRMLPLELDDEAIEVDTHGGVRFCRVSDNF